MAVARETTPSDPQTLLNQNPCLDCLSETELLQLLLYLLMAYYGEEGDINGAVGDTVCYQCLSDKQKLEVMVSSLAEATIEGALTHAQIVEFIRCVKCVPIGAVKAAITSYIVQYIEDSIAVDPT